MRWFTVTVQSFFIQLTSISWSAGSGHSTKHSQIVIFIYKFIIMNSDLIFGIIAFLLIMVVIFLVLREVICWYWKININIELQEEQIELQKETIRLLEKFVNGKKEATLIDVNQNKLKEVDKEGNPEILSNNEIEEVNSKISYLKVNEIIVIHPLSRVIKRIHKSDYDASKGWIIVKEFEK